MTENEIGRRVVDICLRIHRRLGPGLFESVYETVLVHELEQEGLRVERQVPISIVWDDIKIKEAFRADIIVEGKVILELKSIEKTLPVHKEQLLTYLKLSGMRLGFLLNFGEELMKSGIARLICGNPP